MITFKKTIVIMPVKDLSTVNHLIDDLFKWPTTEEEWGQYALTDEQIQFFNENGFLAGVKLLNETQIERLRNELAELVDAHHPGHGLFYEFHSNESTSSDSILFHALGAWRITNGFHDVLWNPAFVMAASQLLGNKAVRFWHDQLFYKPAKKGGVVAWHQDYSYWTRTTPLAHLTCWCGLDDSTVENGCLQYVPGSHKWGLLDKPELAGDLMGIMDYLTPEQQAEFKPIPVETKAGEGIFHHGLTLHGSGENKSDRPRRAFVVNVFADGVKSDADAELLKGVPIINKGEQMQGQFFPLLFNPAEVFAAV
ncbi:phytanoyl-CoA dioxygenase family protein [Danxiaibacter flavus]|uniref:Phytanoyl-CoA dioxygenase family protein n=1 Tax=Danxiaibacter flavus TaxID=3049108 RepID=A0ABV3Z881_9BACT|nr:phytanoyl-CoA dioxygenase family protein [Chitinophagaceae bacterium DXS]